MLKIRFLFIVFFFSVFLFACRQEQPTVAHPKIHFLRKAKWLSEGVWVEKSFANIVKIEKRIGKALKSSKNPLMLKINYKNYRNDSLFISILTTKGKLLHFPLLLRQKDERFMFEFPSLSIKTKNYLTLSVSPKDTLLQIKLYDTENQLVDVRNYIKIASVKNGKSLGKTANEFLNTILLEGNYKWGLAPEFLYYQCNATANSQFTGFDGFDKFYFLLDKSSTNRIKLQKGKQWSIYEFAETDGIIRLSKLKENSIGKSSYYLKPIFILRQHSQYFNSEVTHLEINDNSEQLSIKLNITVPPTFPAKIDSFYRKIINSGFFNYKLFKNGKVIPTSKQFTKKNLGKLYTQSGYLFFSELGIKQPTHNYQAEITIPKYALKSLGTGQHRIRLYIYQRPYSQAFEERKKKNLNHVYIDKKKEWIWAKVDFDVTVPFIYTSELQLNEIKINRHANMDFSLKKNGSKADIYWSIFYPNSQFYWRSKVKRSTNIYRANDVVKLFSYSENPEFIIAVFDEDRGSNPELIGKKSFLLSEIPNDFSDFSFDKVDILKIKSVK